MELEKPIRSYNSNDAWMFWIFAKSPIFMELRKVNQTAEKRCSGLSNTLPHPKPAYLVELLPEDVTAPYL